MIGFTLSFEGNDADNSELEFYDAAQAMIGFQRSLAITTHLIVNGEVITQAPALKNARILTVPPEQGSWKIPALISAISIGGYHLGTADKETPLGHLMHSAYDYVVSETMGFHVDYEKSLGRQYDELKKQKRFDLPTLDQTKFDSVIEKCESAVREMHRPIIKSKSATSGQILVGSIHGQMPLEHRLNHETFEYISATTRDSELVELRGKISSYNINTYKGRIFLEDEQRPIPFELSDEARTIPAIRKITESLSSNAIDRFRNDSAVTFRAFINRSKSGRVKSLYVSEVF